MFSRSGTCGKQITNPGHRQEKHQLLAEHVAFALTSEIDIHTLKRFYNVSVSDFTAMKTDHTYPFNYRHCRHKGLDAVCHIRTRSFSVN